MKFDIHKKEWEGLLYENGAGEKIVGHSKLKLWTFFWGHGEHEWPLHVAVITLMRVTPTTGPWPSLTNASNDIISASARVRIRSWIYINVISMIIEIIDINNITQ